MKKIIFITITTYFSFVSLLELKCQNNELWNAWDKFTNESVALNTQISNIYRYADYNKHLPDSDKVKLAILKPKLDSVTHLAHKTYLEMNEAEFNQRLKDVLAEDPKDWRKTYDKLSWLYSKKEWYYLIAKHTDELLPYVDYDYKKNSSNQRILILINTPQNLKDSLLQLDGLDIEERARLGDTAAENAIIKGYRESLENPTTEFRFLTWGEKLLYAGTEKCMKAYVSGFDNNHILHPEQSREKTAVLVYLLSQFSVYYPQVYITSNVKTANHKDPSRWRLNGDKLFEVEEEYIQELEQYCRKEYGVELDIELPFLEVDIEEAYPH